MEKNEYEGARIGVDPVIFTIHSNELKVLLHKREKEPFKGKFELPGGLLEQDETAEITLQRKLKEMISQDQIYFTQFYTFTDPGRDPRTRTVSIGFVALISEEKLSGVQGWYDLTKLPALAFDHKKIITTARQYLKETISPAIVQQFMPESFPLNKLQEVYELLEEIKYDNRNFRKKMISSGIVEETDEVERNVSHRPARLFKFSR